MKKIVLILFSVLAVLQLTAQLEYDERRKIIPFSQANNYNDKIDINDINTYKIPYLNNDSLFREHNNGKTIDEIKNDFVSGFFYDKTPFSLKSKGTKIELSHGTLWLYKIDSKSAGAVSVNIKCPSLKSGRYLAFIATDTTVNVIQPPTIYQNDNVLERHKKRGLSEGVFGKSFIIEYYEPYNTEIEEDIFINYIIYSFVGFGNKVSSPNNSKKLKSGVWGNTAHPSCQHDVLCPEYFDWKNESKSVVLFFLEFYLDKNGDGIDEIYSKTSTGVFLNKVGNYTDSDNPLAITAGHLYSSELENGTRVDINNLINQFGLFTAYENIDCGIDDLSNPGIKLPGSFQRISIGSDFDVLPSESGYSASNDFAILEASGTAEDLTYYDIEYAAWSTNYDLTNSNNVGYTTIHHPNGDVKKINKDNHRAYTEINNDFNLYFDLGLSEVGTSGAPVFNSLKQVVGWAAGASNLADCQYIGQVTSQNKTVCGSLDDAYFYFYPLLDPNLSGEATSSNPQPPLPSELPAHCRNCIRDEDETGIDCGGSCYPCGMQDVVTLKTPMDIPTTVKSRYEIFAEPDPGSLLALTGGSYSLEAGINVYLKGGFVVEKGAEFYAGIDAELMSEPDRGCGNSCVQLYSLIEPDGDGYLDYLLMKQAFITSYDIMVIDYWNDVEYTANNLPVYANGIINVWDGSGGQSGSKRVVINYTDCNGYEHENSFYISYLSGEKSATLIDQNTETSVDDINKNANIIVYPNPFSNDVTINFAGGKFPLEYKIMDLTGKVFFHNKTSSSREVINLSGLAAGTYVINAKAGEFNLVEKLIKR